VTPDTPDALCVLFHVADLLEAAGLDYHVGGSFASSIHGVPRTTQDIDIVVDLPPREIPALVRSLSPDFFVQEDVVREAVRARRSFNAIHLDSGLKVDFFIRGEGAFDLEEFGRHRAQELTENRSVPIKSPEDTVLRKLQWYRDGGEISDRQWGDVMGILRTQGASLDHGYLRNWGAALGVGDLLERALDDS